MTDNNNSNAARLVDWDQLYPGEFLKAGLLGTDKRTLTISDLQMRDMETDEGSRSKCIVSFAEEKLKMPLNKTNGICMREMFGRVPYKWIGKRIAIFQTMWGDDPAIRIWGSPDLTADLVVTVQLPKRRAFTMTMHAMGAVRAPDKAPLGERCQELIKLMGLAFSDEELTDIEADFATEEFDDRETQTLTRALAKRRKQVASQAGEVIK